MMIEHLNLHLVLLLTAGFVSASFFGYIAHRLDVSPILGYLVAGFFIGPYSPFYVGNVALAESLAEIGVILMMFSVGLKFSWSDIVGAKKVAIPGGLLQTASIACFGTLLFLAVGYGLQGGIIFGVCLGVASTVVLIRCLSENNLINTPQGHLCVSWLILEDKIAVATLLLLPTLAITENPLLSISTSLVWLFIKFFVLVLVLFTAGKWLSKRILEKVAATKVRELYTITVLALAFCFAEMSNAIFGISIVIGAFMAGIVIGKTDAGQQVSSHIRPIKEAFIVLFFLTIGMLFDIKGILDNFPLFAGTLVIILIAKPLTAYVISKGFGRSRRDALTVAVALAQIGEFSFILAEEANRYQILPDIGYDVLVACALVSIACNPFLFTWAKAQYKV
jgi:CPA2 family monovalent cation:H+ antiporter-2